ENPDDANGNNVYDVNVIAYNNQGDGDGQFISVIVNNLKDTEAPTIVSNGGGRTAVIHLNEGETQVTDVNISGASDVVYAINAGADADLFTINSQTGELSFKVAPDYEAPTDADGNNVYFANIIAYNQYGGDGQFVSVVVKDVADTTVPDIFSDGGERTAVVYLNEGETDVTDVNASGDDNVVYAINAGADADLFTIDAQTGELAFKTAPDHESPADADSNNVYFANVIAYNDQGGDSQFISVIVKDVKETALPPEIISDGGGDATTLSRKEGEKQVTQVVATAADPGSTLTFSLAGGEDASLFSINAYTGALSFQNEPDYENPTDSDGDNTYDVVVKVTDAAGQFDRQTLSIDVTNVASVYLMAGQSNMVGYGSNSELPSHLADPYEGAKIWQYDSQSFTNLRPGFAGWSGERDRFGPELTFGREIAERSDEDIYLIKYAQGATSLASDWDPQAANQRYDELISRVEAALIYLEDGGVDYRVEGMVWMQGESDTYNDDYAAAYEDNLSAFIADVRSRYGDDLEFSIGRISNTLPTSPFNRAAVRAAQASVAGQSSLNHLVSTDGLGVIEDGVHFGTQGQIALGAAFANTFDV
ncbi:MAG: sialate O-acetylesterase, partial [Cyanobacteria bacterium P01_F01_bin.4]